MVFGCGLDDRVCSQRGLLGTHLLLCLTAAQAYGPTNVSAFTFQVYGRKPSSFDNQAKQP